MNRRYSPSLISPIINVRCDFLQKPKIYFTIIALAFYLLVIYNNLLAFITVEPSFVLVIVFVLLSLSSNILVFSLHTVHSISYM